MKKKTKYICENCGYESIGYYGKCPECSSWNSMKEVVEDKKGVKGVARSEKRPIKD